MTPAPYPSSRCTLCSTWCCTCSGGSETDTERAAVLIQRSPAEARLFLERLVEAGPAEARGRTKARTFHLAAATYRRLGDKAAYVYRRGFEPIQQEQMILQYIESHGATRGARRRNSAISRQTRRTVPCSGLWRRDNCVKRAKRRGPGMSDSGERLQITAPRIRITAPRILPGEARLSDWAHPARRVPPGALLGGGGE